MSDPTLASDDPLHPEQLERSRNRVRRHAHRARRRQSQRIVYVVAALSAVAGAFAAGAPTGVAIVDGGYRAVFAALVPLAAARARRWTWFVVAGVAGAVGSEDAVPLAIGASSLAVSFGSLRYGRRQREFGAVAGALAVQALLRLPTDLPFATPTIAAVVAVLPLFLSSLRNVRRPRRFVWPAVAALGVIAVVTVGFAVAMYTIESHASDGVAAARDGLAAAGRGDDAASVAAFTVADREFDAAAATADAWWLTPARGVPVLAPHIDAARDVSTQGRSLAALGADQAAVLDIRGLSTATGGIDLGAVADLAPRAASVADALDAASRVLADADSPWLLAPVTERIDDFATEIAEVAPAARVAADALALAPSLLGADGPQTYVTLVGNPAESRELGGFVAAVGVLTADDGSLDFESLGSVSGLNAQVVDAGLTVDRELPPPLPASSPEQFVQNWANTADFSIVGDIAGALGPALTDASVDGVLYLDPYAVASLLELTGPVTIEGRPEPLRAEDAVDYLLREQYLSDDFEDDGERKDRLRDAAEAAFEELTSSSLPDPRRLADQLSPLVRARRLLFTTTDDGAHELLKRVGLRPSLDLGAADQLLLAQEDLRANKLDAYLSRSLTYDLDVGDDGAASGTLTVELTNRAPAEGLPPYVTGDGGLVRITDPLPEALHRISLDLYSRLDVDDVTIDGASVGSGSNVVGGLVRTAVRVDIPPESTVTVVFSVSGNVGDRGYELDVVPNGTAGVDTFTATIRLPDGTIEVPETSVDAVLRAERAG